MSKLSSLRVLIAGCGNIAGGFDLSRSADEPPYTHAGAYARDARFCLTACVEPDDERRERFMDAWGVLAGFGKLEEVVNSVGQFDVISICSPKKCHMHDLEIALHLKPKVIFCEKPITSLYSEAEYIVTQCRDANVLLAVNHTRRWDTDVSRLQADIKSGRWGQLRSVVGYYNKGVLNNGSHMLDMLDLLLGPMNIIKVGKPIHDFFPNDPTIPVWLEGEQGLPVQLACGHAEDYAIFELQLIFSHGVVTMEDGGLYWRERSVVQSENFKGYRVLEEGVRRVGEYPRAMLNALDNIYLAISRGDALASTGESALAAHRLCEQIKRQSVVL